jgi:hypothetical protein
MYTEPGHLSAKIATPPTQVPNELFKTQLTSEEERAWIAGERAGPDQKTANRKRLQVW